MRINSNRETFKGIKIASADVKLNRGIKSYDMYRVTSNDADYLDKLFKDINLEKLWTGLDSLSYKFWSKIINITLRHSRNFETVLIAEDNKPCGVISYAQKGNRYDVRGRATWPIQKDKKSPFAGTALYLNLFQQCLNKDVKFIRTVASRLSPFDVVSKCFDLGFRSIGGDNCNEVMSVNQERMRATLNKFGSTIVLHDCNTAQEVDLSKTLGTFSCDV